MSTPVEMMRKKFLQVKRQLKYHQNISSDPLQRIVFKSKHVTVSEEYDVPPIDVFLNYTDEWAWWNGWLEPYYR